MKHHSRRDGVAGSTRSLDALYDLEVQAYDATGSLLAWADSDRERLVVAP